MKSLDMFVDNQRVENPGRVNHGTHKLQLYAAPVPPADEIPLEEHYHPKDWQRYGEATLRLSICEGPPRPGSLTPSEASDDEDEVQKCPPVRIPCKQRVIIFITTDRP